MPIITIQVSAQDTEATLVRSRKQKYEAARADFTVCAGLTGTQRDPYGIAITFKNKATGEPVDLTGATLFLRVYLGSALILEKTSDITWDADTGRISIPLTKEDTLFLGQYEQVSYGIEQEKGPSKWIILAGNINISAVINES